MREGRAACFASAVIAGAVALGSCRAEDGGETPPMLRARFETEMRTILRDVKMAQETAAATEGAYLELDALKGRFLNRPIPETYRLSLGPVTATGFTAEIEHRATGLSCRLEVGDSGSGVPNCG